MAMMQGGSAMADHDTSAQDEDVLAFLGVHMPATRAIRGRLPRLSTPFLAHHPDGTLALRFVDEANSSEHLVVGYDFAVDLDTVTDEREFDLWVHDCARSIFAANN
jgi:hypothetical protein